MSLPVFRGSSAALYPFTMSITFRTVLARFENGSEKRSIAQPAGLVHFELPYASLTQSQKDTVDAAVTASLGQLDNTLTLTLGGTTYSGLSLDSDQFSAQENETMQYQAPLKLTQTVPQNFSPGTPGLAFPALANSAMGILPFTQQRNFKTITQKVAAGPKYSTALFGGGFTGYPVNGLKSWQFEERNLSDADAATRLAHFIANYGRGYAFPFTDETTARTNAALTSGAGSVSFASNPFIGNPIGQVMQIDSEQLQVTSVYSGGSVSVSRGFNGTTAAAHASNALVAWVYLSTRYSSDVLSFRYNRPNATDVTIGLQQTN